MSSRFVVVLLLGSLAILSLSQYQKWEAQKKIQKQIDALKAESQEIGEKNAQLESSLQYLASAAATERLARQQLNMKKDGEVAVVFLAGTKETAEQVAESKQIPVWKQWWEYFFVH